MLYGNKTSVHLLRTYLQQLLSTGNGVPFFILVGPRWVGKSSHAQEIIQESLWSYFSSDFLYLKDYSKEIWELHVLKVGLTQWEEFLSAKKKGKEESDESEPVSIDNNDEKYPNIWVREMNDWLQKSSFSGSKFVLIENLERANASSWWAAMNALLKTLEEPLPHRIIIATLQEKSQILPTILSRAIIIPFSNLSSSEMEDFIKDLPIEKKTWVDSKILTLLSDISLWRPWIFFSFLEKIQKDPWLWESLYRFFQNWWNSDFPLFELLNDFTVLTNSWLIEDIIDGWIFYCAKNGNISLAQKWINAKKIIWIKKGSLSRDKLFLDIMIS